MSYRKTPNARWLARISKGNTMSRRNFLVMASATGAVVAGIAPVVAQVTSNKVNTPTISCGEATQKSINIQVCAGASGAPAGFSLQ